MTPQPGHEHDGIMSKADPQAHEPYDSAALARLVGASFDGCAPCQRELTPLVAADPVAVARLVELVGMMAQDQFGGVPSAMYRADSTSLTPEFRELMRWCVKGGNERDRVIAASRSMTLQQRTSALDAAAEMAMGYLSMVAGPRR